MTIKKLKLGYCTICDKPSLFYSNDIWLRDHYHCIRCSSIPRQRALVHIIKKEEPEFRSKIIHESSASGATKSYLMANCCNYSVSNYLPKVKTGTVFHDGSTCENLECLTMKDESIEIFISQDVMEHVFNPEVAFKEISRVLKKGGKHIFTVPLYTNKKTQKRVEVKNDNVIHLLPPEYHMNPVDKKGSLVTYDWSRDIVQYIKEWTGMYTRIYSFPVNRKNRYYGLEAEYLQILVSYKSG